MTLSPDIADFTRRNLTFRGKTKPVLVSGASGPAVIVLHEAYGVTPTLLRLCRWFRDGGFRVYVPVLLGRPDATNPEKVAFTRTLALCVSREFTLFATGRPSPVTHWLRDLAHTAPEQFRLRGYRFNGDALCRAVRFEALRRALGDAFLYREFSDEDGNLAGFRAQGKPPHSVFTGDLIDQPGAATRQAVDEVIGFFRERFSTEAAPAG